MNLAVHALSSGSSGNATLIQCDGQALLIDAGLSAKRLSEAIKRKHVTGDNLVGVLVTHEHDDHTSALGRLTTGFKSTVIANQKTLNAISFRTETYNQRVFATGDSIEIGPFTVQSFPVLHDAAEPVGYTIAVNGHKIFYATDIGQRTELIQSMMKDSSLCIIESNYDPRMLQNGPYSPMMKARVSGGSGHLSNGDASELIARRMEQGPPCSFWLAHLSAVNNTPRLAKTCVESRLQSIKSKSYRVDVALRDRPSVSWSPGQVANQLSLF
ncbi:MAG: MBL fold metallo-hydrolase [Chthonomonadales bacterium]